MQQFFQTLHIYIKDLSEHLSEENLFKPELNAFVKLIKKKKLKIELTHVIHEQPVTN